MSKQPACQWPHKWRKASRWEERRTATPWQNKFVVQGRIKFDIQRTWNDLINVQSNVRMPSPRLRTLTNLITRNKRKKLILITLVPGWNEEKRREKKRWWCDKTPSIEKKHSFLSKIVQWICHWSIDIIANIECWREKEKNGNQMDIQQWWWWWWWWKREIFSIEKKESLTTSIHIWTTKWNDNDSTTNGEYLMRSPNSLRKI